MSREAQRGEAGQRARARARAHALHRLTPRPSHPSSSPQTTPRSYEIYDPRSGTFSGDKYGMQEQLAAAFPVHTYPHIVLLPDGGLAISAGKLMVRGCLRLPLLLLRPAAPGPPVRALDAAAARLPAGRRSAGELPGGATN